MIFTDASNHAYGGFISNSNTTEAYGIWSEQEQDQSSTFRELKAIHNLIEPYAPLLAHSKVKLFSDNQGACTIVDKGSPKLILNQLAIDIFVLALHNDITLVDQWIPRSENERADIISKFLDKSWFSYDRWRSFTIAGIASKLFSDRSDHMETKFSSCKRSQRSRSLG